MEGVYTFKIINLSIGYPSCHLLLLQRPSSGAEGLVDVQ